MSEGLRTVESVIEAHRGSGLYLDVGGVKTFLLDDGSGPAVVCLHGVPTSSYLYRKVLPALVGHGLRGIAFDYPGLGLSDRPTNFDYSFRGLTDFSVKVIQTIGLDAFHLVVHDIGGPIGFALAGSLRDKVQSITILNTWVEVDKFSKPLPMRPFGVKGVGELQLKLINHYTWALAFKAMAVRDSKGISKEEVYAYVDLLKREDGGAAFLKIMRGFDYSAAFKQLCYDGVVDVPYPVQAIWGMNDPGLTFERYGREIKKVIRPITFHQVPGSHLLQEEHWRFIADKVAAQVLK